MDIVYSKGYSMLRLIDDDEYKAGIKKLERQLENGSVSRKSAGGSLVWFKN